MANESKVMTKALLDKADSLFNGNEYEASRAIYLQAMDQAVKNKENSEMTEAYAMIARTYLVLDKKEEGRPWIQKAEKIANSKEPLGWSRYLGVRGRFEWKDSQLEKATSTFKEMYNYCSGRKLYERAIDAAHMVAITGKPEEQIEWGNKGIKEAETGNVTRWLGPLWNNLGATYEDMGKYKEALEAYLKAREYHFRYGDEKNKLVADWAVGHAYRLNGDNLNAEKWLRPVLAWCERTGDVEFEGLTYRELGEIELSKTNPDSALSYFSKAEEKLKQAGMPEWDSAGFAKLQNQIAELQKNK
ncbi:MAG TPA: tetratricopeptide repeat protein [Terriglobales bacterium]|nr:tetratricopeptide repeat protein [Terriglobales bacterium]